MTPRADTLYFLDSYDPSYDYEGGRVISCNPEVSYLLSRQGMAYHIPEEYYSEEKLLSDRIAYFHEQLQWFGLFDDFLKQHISYCKKLNIPLATSNYLRLKYVIDTVVIYAHVISGILEANRDTGKAVYFHPSFYRMDGEFSPFSFKSKSRRVFSDMLGILCKKYGIEFFDRPIFSPYKEDNPDNSAAMHALKNYAKLVTNFFKYQKFAGFKPAAPLGNINVFVMHAGSAWIDQPVKELIRKGCNVYLMENGRIINENRVLRHALALPPLEESFFVKLEKECQVCADYFIKSDLLDWVNDKCGMDISSVIAPFFEYFIKKDCCRVISDTVRASRFYRDRDIDFVIARANTERSSAGWILAARYGKKAKSICVQHACLNQALETSGIMDTRTFDRLLTADYISQDFYSNFIRNDSNNECVTHLSSHYLKHIKNVRSRNAGHDEKRSIVYVTSKFSAGVRSLNSMGYPLTWYYELQRRIIDLFGREYALNFLYKTVQRGGQDGINRSITNYIKEKGYNNIVVSDDYFPDVLHMADKVIVDQPSTTALFEAGCAGKSVLVVYPEYLDRSILGISKKVFGKCLRPFSDFNGAEKAVKDFLHSQPDDYRVNIPLSQSGFMDAFQQIVMEQEGVKEK